MFFLAVFHLSHERWLLENRYKKKNSRIFSESEEIINFDKHAQIGDEANYFPCWYLKHSNQISQFAHLVSVQRIQQKSSRNVLQTRIMVAGAKFNSHDSGSYFKKTTFKYGCQKKSSYIVVTELKLHVRMGMKFLNRITLLLAWKSQLFLKNNWGMRLKLSSASLTNFLTILQNYLLEFCIPFHHPYVDL